MKRCRDLSFTRRLRPRRFSTSRIQPCSPRSAHNGGGQIEPDNLKPEHRPTVTERAGQPQLRRTGQRVRSDEVRRCGAEVSRRSPPATPETNDTGAILRALQGRREMAKPGIWPRVLAMLKLEPGIVQEIASDPRSTKQGLIVLGSQRPVSSLLAFPLIPIFVPLLFVGIVINAGTALPDVSTVLKTGARVSKVVAGTHVRDRAFGAAGSCQYLDLLWVLSTGGGLMRDCCGPRGLADASHSAAGLTVAQRCSEAWNRSRRG